MKPSIDDIKKAARLLEEGQLVAFPTETVYGLGANALLDEAVAGIYEAKGRPSFNPLIVHVATFDEAQKYATFNEKAQLLAKQLWPGPLTLVLPRREDCGISLLVSAGLETIALRVPAHATAQALLKAAKLPIAAPSANQSGRISPTQASHVHEDLGGRVAMVLDGGYCTIGIESTVVDMTSDVPVILRPGSVTEAQLSKIVGKISAESDGVIKSPGMIDRHYAPTKKLRLNATGVREGEALLAFGKALPGAVATENLSPSSNLREAAANLFRMLRILDTGKALSIAAMPIPEEGLGVAINDRLKRAAFS
jgi:L-threonylcarbamoyladenylate synthase